MLAIIIINSILVATAVLVHFEALNLLTAIIPKIPVKRRLSILLGVFGAISAHVVEIWIFAFAYLLLIAHGGFGSLQNSNTSTVMDLLDCVYFSFTCYTSVGFGDIRPLGDLRFLAGLEALTGVVLIAWTASFMFIEMQKLWRIK